MFNRREMHRIAARANAITVTKNGKLHRTPSQKLAKLIENLTWQPPEIFKNADGIAAAVQIRAAFPLLDFDRAIRERSPTLMHLEEAVKHYIRSGDADEAVIDGFSLNRNEHFQKNILTMLKDSRIAGLGASLTSAVTTISLVASRTCLDPISVDSWRYLLSEGRSVPLSYFRSGADLDKIAACSDDAEAGAVIVDFLWCHAVNAASARVTPSLDDWESRDISTEEAALAAAGGSAKRARHTIAELIEIGANAHLYVDMVKKFSENNSIGYRFHPSIPDELLREAMVEHGAGIAPASFGWKGVDDFWQRIEADASIQQLSDMILAKEYSWKNGRDAPEADTGLEP